MGAFVAHSAAATPGQMLALATAVNKALRSETANIGAVSVASGAASVTIQDPRCRTGRLALLIPLNAAAAAVTWYLSNMTQNSMTFTFGSALGGAADFGYAFIGDGNS